jgi:methylated-DNA-protein-cysteine methyltransferase related protein
MGGNEDLSLSERIAGVVGGIPSGKVASYGQVAAIAGNPLAARQVVRTLKMWSRTRNLPWYRVVNREGRISLPPGGGYEEQRRLLESEGVAFGLDGRIDMRNHRWPGPRGQDRDPDRDPE